ncbi:hypothetical protein RCC89_00915 [Cytophagaceae bacterium ABcell3]|nr:hypothetical protein RCC89_00915 [Cytophagaceae bacterium ABcell3]
MKKIISFCFLFIIVISSVSAQQLGKRKVADGVKVALPKDFTKMTDDDIVVRYYTHKKPLALYTSEDRNIGFGFNIASVSWQFTDLELLRKFYKATVLSMFNKVDLINEGVKTVNGQEYAFLEFTSNVDRIKNYFYVQYIIVHDRIFVFHMMCPVQGKQKWAPVAHEVMESIKVNPNKLRKLEVPKQVEPEPRPVPTEPKTPTKPKDPAQQEDVPTFR